MQIYIIQRESGIYEDRRVSNIRAFTDREEASNLCDRLNQLVDELYDKCRKYEYTYGTNWKRLKAGRTLIALDPNADFENNISYSLLDALEVEE